MFWAVVIGLFSGCATVIDVDFAAPIVAALCIPGLSLQGGRSVLVKVVSGDAPAELARAWGSWAWLGYAIVVAALVLAHLRRAGRSRRHDALVLLSLLMPLFVLDVYVDILPPPPYKTGPQTIPMWQGKEGLRFWYYAAAICAGSTLLGFLATPVLSRYRRLPWST
jgi:hypothetical protein